MNARYLSHSISLMVLVPLVLTAQAPRGQDPVPLKNWPAPLYWQPPEVERGTSHGTQSPFTPMAATNPPLGSSALVFVAMPPCRVMDTRSGQGFTGGFGPPSIAAGQPVRTIPIQSSTTCSIPSLAQAYSFNVTVVPPGPLVYITLFPATSGTQPAPPNASTLNAPNGGIVANAAIVPAGSDSNGSVDVYASNPTDLIIDINGYYAAAGDLNGNTALGPGALANNNGGSDNTATGSNALQGNTSGIENTASGFDSLQNNTTGNDNTASGYWSLLSNTTGIGNTGVGASALRYNTTGNQNTACGRQALINNTLGSNNIGVGFQAGINAPPGNNYNIEIGTLGTASDSGTIRIGDTANETSFFAAGIRGITTGSNNAVPVVIDSNGQLGTVNSSRRFKEDIHDMGDASNGLLRLRPVTFRYKKPFADGSKPMEYGLIAEEVEQVYPDLVARSADGKIETVKYQVLDSMLLNEVQKQAEKNRLQEEKIRLLEERLGALETLLPKAAGGDRQ